MATLQESIEVEVPVSTAYNQWTQFESFPQFMKGVESVEQIDETSLHFRTRWPASSANIDAQILEQTPDQCIAWVSKDKPRNAGRVTFESLGADLCRVNVELEWEPEGLLERTGAAAHVDETAGLRPTCCASRSSSSPAASRPAPGAPSVDRGEVDAPERNDRNKKPVRR